MGFKFMRKLVTLVAAAAVLLVPQLNLMAQSDEALAIMIPGGGSPNPNSRYAGLPDDPQGAGLAAIRRALDLANNGTQRERDMINALFVLYNKDAIPDSRERDFAFVDAMRNLHDRYPDDADIATMFGESYMNTTRWDYWEADGAAKPGTAEAQAAFESAMRSEHDHPGANHLYIHLMEASSQPELAMPAAQKLEATVPISGHMVHMPGHIYLRVGEYEKAIDINERSQIVDAQFAEIWGDTNFPMIGTYPLSHKIHKGHALDFVRYANMLQGNYAESSAAAVKNAGSTEPDITSGLKNIAHTWITDKVFGKWDKIHADNAVNSQYEAPYLKGMWSYVMGSAHVAKGHMGPAEAELANIQAQITADGVNDNGVSPTPASHVLNLASHALNGEIEEAKGNLDAAIMHYNVAIQLQDSLNYTEPPDWSQSIRLYLGAVLLEAGRAAEAEAVYMKDLEWNQQNGWTTFGLYQALEAQGKTQEAIIVERQFQSFFRNADVEITRSRL